MEPRNASVTLSIETSVKYPRLHRKEFWQRIVSAAMRADPKILGSDKLIVRGARVDVIQPVKVPAKGAKSRS